MKITKLLAGAVCAASFAAPLVALADGIVSKIVTSPLTPTGLVKGANTGINIYLQNEDVQGIEFMDPNVVGYGIPAGGRVEIEFGGGFERIRDVEFTQKTMMMLSGVPHQPMRGKEVGYQIGEGAKPNIMTLTPTSSEGLVAEDLMSAVPGVKADPVPSRGFKVFHIGLFEYPFKNTGDTGTVAVRIIDGEEIVVAQGAESVGFLDEPVPQVQPTNFPDGNRNHNWQVIKSGEILGKTPGTLPLSVAFFDKTPDEDAPVYKNGIEGVGVLSPPQLKAMEFEKPESLSRYNGGLIIQDINGDYLLDPAVDKIIGGVVGSAPEGATGQELRSLDVHGAGDLSRPGTAYHAGAGKTWGGSTLLMQFTGGSVAGLYRPTLALLSNPDDFNSTDGSTYTFTIVVK